MPSMRIKAKTSVSPEQFITALTDFGPGRAKVWGNSQPHYLIVHNKGSTWAEVTEGSDIFGGVWERLRYDWSNPNHIILQTIDSNLWHRDSGWHYELTPTADGSRTKITYTITRFAKTKRGYVLMVILSIAGKPILTKDFRRTLRAIEAQR